LFEGACVEADATVTLGELKRGLVMPPGNEIAGMIDVADIGLPERIISGVPVRTWMPDVADCYDRLPVRPANAHKGDFGKVAVIAGSRGMTGAAALASMAALKAGAGLVVLGCPASLNEILEVKLTEVMTRPLPETAEGSLARSAGLEIEKLLEWADILAIGPGLSVEEETGELVRQVVSKTKLPVVLDADGLTAFARHTPLLRDRAAPTVLTPHPGELAKLTGRPLADILSDPIETARECASELESTLILKGGPTVIAHSDGEVFVNSSGNSGMATAGSGDVLTGLIAGLLAQGCPAKNAGLCGVMLHGLAGDAAADVDDGRSITAGDLLHAIGPAFRQIEELE
jgi:NAD(P)H-hydrate epimerase